jgi:hypothetical protein
MFPTFRLIVNGPVVEAAYRFEFDTNIYSDLAAYNALLDLPITARICMTVAEDHLEIVERTTRRIFILKKLHV